MPGDKEIKHPISSKDKAPLVRAGTSDGKSKTSAHKGKTKTQANKKNTNSSSPSSGDAASSATAETTSKPTPGPEPSSPLIPAANDRRDFLVIDNAGDGIDSSWSFVLTDDEARSTSSSESASVHEENTHNLFSDDSDDELHDDSRRDVKSVGTPSPAGATTPATSSSSDEDNSITDFSRLKIITGCDFAVPRISLSPRKTEVSGNLNSSKFSSWIKAISLMLLVTAVHQSLYLGFFGQYKNKRKDLNLQQPKEVQAFQPAEFTTVVVRTTVTETIELPVETVTVHGLQFQVPQVLKDYSPAPKINAAYENYVKPIYDDKVKDSRFEKSVASGWAATLQKAHQFDDYLFTKYSEVFAGSLIFGDNKKLADLGSKCLYQFRSAVAGAEHVYTKVSPVVTKYTLLAKQRSLALEDHLAKITKEKYAAAKDTVTEMEYSKKLDNFCSFVSKKARDGSAAVKKLSDDVSQSSCMQSTVDSGSEAWNYVKEINLFKRKVDGNTVKEKFGVFCKYTKKQTDAVLQKYKRKTKHASLFARLFQETFLINL